MSSSAALSPCWLFLGCEGLEGPSWTQAGPAQTGKEFSLFSQFWAPRSREELNTLPWAPGSGRRAAGRARGDQSAPHSLPGTPLTRARLPAGTPCSHEGAHPHLKAWSSCLPVSPSPCVSLGLCLPACFPLPVTVSLMTSCPNPTPKEGTWGVGAELMQRLGLGNQE